MFANLDAERYDREYRDLDLVRRVANYALPVRRKWLLVVAATAALGGLQACVPILISRGVAAIEGASSSRWLAALTTAVFAVGILIWVANLVRRRALVDAVADAVLAMRCDAFEAALGQDLARQPEIARNYQ